MNKAKIITDSCSSLTQDEMKTLGVDYLQMSIIINGEPYNAFEHPITDPKKFYEELKKADSCSTSCINTQSYLDIFEKYVKDGYDVFYTGLSSGLSCSYDNAIQAASELNKKYGKHVYVGDSLIGSFSIGAMVIKAVEMANAGKSAKEIFNAIDKNGMKTCALFMPSDLQFLMRSGRINKLVASVGSMLKLVPILTANEEGKLKVVNKAIGRKRAMKTIETLFLEKADLTSPETIYIGHTGEEEEAKEMAEFLKNNTQNKQIKIGYIDYTMGCCCGPSTLCVFFTQK